METNRSSEASSLTREDDTEWLFTKQEVDEFIAVNQIDEPKDSFGEFVVAALLMIWNIVQTQKIPRTAFLSRVYQFASSNVFLEGKRLLARGSSDRQAVAVFKQCLKKVSEDKNNKDSRAQTFSSDVLSLSDPARARIRYIAGSAIRLVSKALEARQMRLSYSKIEQAKQCKEMLLALRTIKVNKHRLPVDINDQVSLQVCLPKENEGSSLTYISDDAFRFFLSLWCFLTPWFAEERRLTRRTPSNANSAAENSQALTHQWQCLFEEVSIGAQATKELYAMVLLRIIRTRTWEARKMVNRKLKKEFTRRMQVERRTAVPVELTDQPAALEPVENDTCILCAGTVVDSDGGDVDWLQCDGCDDWYHRICTGMEPSEFRRIGDSEWECPFCEEM
ncbi:uncharacterized protein [Watersipora subatra]|uniref:uncharacterized protein isoform X1 n=1 Tax=Watersipora subatra TaxID=2589382 RepID=UPI00355AF365